ncbi:hypothetical protein K435DRAFT_855326 [Dendrothele bispora CBS 962.96]|uniref:Mid2 domain-containing protein n=1 Tax=Dendrothele bispora (strain CBS 962.96) TaxID=1314807 RepID=A0A4S8MBG7_DENBC|nr:hypothetical protein K435DRAFT_855326 [Dendrothele bispora CBS 962.96]
MITVWEVLDDSDNRIQYDAEWTASGNDTLFTGLPGEGLNQHSLSGDVHTLHEATTVNPSFALKFNATSGLVVYAAWISVAPGDGSSSSISTECAVDGEKIPGVSSSFGSKTRAISVHWQEICQMDSESFGGAMAPGEHEMVVNITKSNDMGLYLDYISMISSTKKTLAQSGSPSLASPSPASPSPASQSPTSSSPSPGVHRGNIKEIIGGTIGGIVTVALILLGFLLWTKRRKERRLMEEQMPRAFVDQQANPYNPFPNPKSSQEPRYVLGTSPNAPETQSGPISHTDSGWRMTGNITPLLAEEPELPPGYTAT